MAKVSSESRSHPASTRDEWSLLAYTGPGTLAGHYLRTFWQPVYRSDDLPVGRPKPIRIMSEDFTLYRGESGLPHVVDYRCAHRGTQLTVGWVEGDEIRCRYHGWKFGPDGQCTEQPGEPEPFCEKIRIKSYPTREYLGLIFAYLGEGEVAEFPRYVAFERDGVRIVDHEVREGNFFNDLDNDPIHVHFTHHRTHHAWRNGLPDRITAEETPCGIYSTTIWPGGGKSRTRPFILMPHMRYRKGNMQEWDGKDTTKLADQRGNIITWVLPLDDERHHRFHIEWFPRGEHVVRYIQRRQEWIESQELGVDEVAAKVFSGEMHLDDIPVGDGADVHWVNQVEDTATQWGQGAIADRASERLGRTDAPIILLRKVWLRELRALADGLPLTKWEAPTDWA